MAVQFEQNLRADPRSNTFETLENVVQLFGSFEGDRDNLPAFGEIYPNYQAPVLRRTGAGALKLDVMTWGSRVHRRPAEEPSRTSAI